MKTLFSKHKWMQLVYGALLLGAGILIIVIANNNPNDFSKWLSIVLSIALFIYASALLFSGVFSLKKKLFDISFVYAVIFVAIGVTLLVNPTMIGQFVTIFIATLLCGSGLVEMGEATAMVFFKRHKFFIVLFYILGAALIALGVLAFVFQNDAQKVMYVASGAILAGVGVVELILGVVSLFKNRKEKKDDKEVEDKKEKDEPKLLEENKESNKIDA